MSGFIGLSNTLRLENTQKTLSNSFNLLTEGADKIITEDATKNIVTENRP